MFSEIEIPPDELATTARPLHAPGRGAEVLFVVDGEAEVTAGTQVRKGGPGACVGAALGAA